MTEIFIYIVLIFALNYIFKRINFIPNYTGEKHQLFTSQKVTQLTGGIYVFLIIVYILYFSQSLYLVPKLNLKSIPLYNNLTRTSSLSYRKNVGLT